MEEEDVDTELEEESKTTLPVEGTYKIIGTLKNKENLKPDYVEELVEVQVSEFVSELMIVCDLNI